MATLGPKWASLTHGLAVPRQNGKNACLEILELYLSVMLGTKILHTAHQVKTAAKHFRRLKHFFGSKVGDPHAIYPDLNAMVKELRSVNGQEAIFLTNGGSIEIIARSSASGRGFTVDVIVCDEAQDMNDEDQESLLSTASSAPSGNPLWIYTGTPPGPKSAGEVFTRIRTESFKAALRPNPRRTWIEWSLDEEADPPPDYTDQENWRTVNPALGSGRLIWAVVEEEFTNLSVAGFCRERLGMWEVGGVKAAIPHKDWRAVADKTSKPMDRYSLGIWVSEDRANTGIGLAGRRPDGTWHTELYEMKPGTGWVVDWVVERVKNNRIVAVVIYSSSPAISLVEDLEEAGVKVTQISTSDVAAACGSLYDGVVGTPGDEEQVRTVYHTDQVQVNTSLVACRRKPILNGKAWMWDGRDEESNTAPIWAITLALWGAQAVVNRKVKRQRTNRRRTGRRAVVLT